MPLYRTERRVRHSAARMFELVADIARYPEFVPLCLSLKLRSRVQNADADDVLLADMEVGYRAIREKFTSKVTLQRARQKILVEYVDGPFRRLENSWSFSDLPGGGSIVAFYIDYEFRSKLLGALMGSMFDAAFRKFAAAFEARADVIYGPGG